MFTSLKGFINSRLGKGVVIEDSSNDYGYFIYIDPTNLYSVLSFLKNDPDLKLALLDQIIAIPSQYFPSISHNDPKKNLKLLYQLKSLKLPYRVTVVLDIDQTTETIPSISLLFRGARWLENDLAKTHDVMIEESLRDHFKKKTHLKFDDSLIISRLQQKELLDIKQGIDFDPKFFPLVTKTTLIPFFSGLPLNFGLDLQHIGSKIISSQVNRGYFHHGLEKTLTTLSPHDAILAISRLHLSKPIFYQIALMTAFEALTDKKYTAPVSHHYAIALEFARIGHHLGVLKHVLLCLEMPSFTDLIHDLYELLKRPLEIFSRVYSQSASKPDNVPFADIHEALFLAQALTEELRSAMSHEDKIIRVLSKKATVTLSMAGSMGLTGTYLRANRSNYDLRRAPLYEGAPAACITDGSDALARFNLRVLEIMASLRWLRQSIFHKDEAADELSPIVIDSDYGQTPPKKPFAFGEIEGPEGDIKIGIFVDSTKNHLIFHVRTPAYFAAQTIPYLLSQADLRDIPIVLYSLGITAEEIDK